MAGKKGRSGRKRKSTQTLKLHGTFRKDRHSTAAPEPPVTAPEPPKWLTGAALAEWKRIVPLLIKENCVTAWDRAALTAYCEEWKLYSNVTQKIRILKGLTVTGSKKQKAEHPLLRVREKCFRRLLQVCAEFGLTPASRARLNIQPEQLNDPLQQWLLDQQKRRQGGGKAG